MLKGKPLSRALSLTMSVVLAIGLMPLPAFAMAPLAAGVANVADQSAVQVVDTGIRATSVSNYEGYACVVNGTERGVVGKDGAFVIPYSATPNGYVVRDGVITQYNSSGELMLDESAQAISARNAEQTGHYALDGTRLVPEGYNMASPFKSGLSLVATVRQADPSEEDLYDHDGMLLMRDLRVIDKSGDTVLELGGPFAHNWYSWAEEGDYGTKIRANWGVGFSTWVGFSEGLIPFYVQGAEDWEDAPLPAVGTNVSDLPANGSYGQPFPGLYGYMDTTGKVAIPCQYAEAGTFSEGLAWVGVLGDDWQATYGYIDASGNLVIENEYTSVYEFNEGLAAVKKDGKWGYIDKTGVTVVPFEYDGAYGAGSGLAAVGLDGKFGLIDVASDEAVVPFEYDDISKVADGVAYAVKDGELYAIYADGRGGDNPVTGGEAMHRLYNPNSGEHFYTADAAERANLVRAGWDYEGVAWTAPTQGDPVYRLYNPNAGDHHYTTDAGERAGLVAVGWTDEGVGWRSADRSGVPLFRLYNPNATGAGSHHYTTDAQERDGLVALGWHDEGVGWYGM